MNIALTIMIDGLTYASWLFIVALGLTLVFGVLKILNVAHGSSTRMISYFTRALALSLAPLLDRELLDILSIGTG